VGDEIEVEIINVDDRGKVKVSHKVTLPGGEESESDGGGRGDRGGRRRERSGASD
jgi:predicted RNA-binding protein with RPS1 domain